MQSWTSLSQKILNTDRTSQAANSPLELRTPDANIRAMNFIYATLVIVGISILTVAGVILAAKGSPWLLLIALGVTIYGFSKHGCAAH